MASLRYRESRIRNGDKVYTYVQLVRSVRRNGKPTHEIVAHLGRLDEREASALKAGLATLQHTKADDDAIATKVKCDLGDIRAGRALRYLDIRVVHEAWRRCGLDVFFDEQLPQGRAKFSHAKLIEVLVINRAVAPSSKVWVPKWVDNTALPEVLGFDVARVDNTRIHRVLNLLHDKQEELQRFLISHRERKGEAAAVIYFDLTSTWFEGRGGDLGEPNRDKAGGLRPRLVHIALAVDAVGRPMRWEVVRGKESEAKVLPRWASALEGYPELRNLPLIFDRGMASEENLRLLLELQRRFVTCSPSPKLSDWFGTTALDAIANTPGGEVPSREVLEDAGLAYVNDDLYVVDKGLISKLPNGKEELPEDGLRAVLSFRPSLFIRHREGNDKRQRKTLAWVDDFNAGLREAKRNRGVTKTRRKVERYLHQRRILGEYDVHLSQIEVKCGERNVRTFQARLEQVGHRHLKRDRNAGWVVLLASPKCDGTAAELVTAYHAKHVVENAFRTIKSFAELRPFRHQTTPKIRAHVTLCVLAMLLDRELELQLHRAGIPMSSQRLYEYLEPCRLQGLNVGQGRRLHQPTPVDDESKRILAALGLEHLATQEAADELHYRRQQA